jgi:hypothetical protein
MLGAKGEGFLKLFLILSLQPFAGKSYLILW